MWPSGSLLLPMQCWMFSATGQAAALPTRRLRLVHTFKSTYEKCNLRPPYVVRGHCHGYMSAPIACARHDRVNNFSAWTKCHRAGLQQWFLRYDAPPQGCYGWCMGRLSREPGGLHSSNCAHLEAYLHLLSIGYQACTDGLGSRAVRFCTHSLAVG